MLAQAGGLPGTTPRLDLCSAIPTAARLRRSTIPTSLRSRGASNRMASTPSVPSAAADTTKPPRSAAAALSGWPSMAQAMRSSSAVDSGSPANAFPARTPPTVAAADAALLGQK